MKKNSYGGILVVFFVCILALCCGTILGMNNIGEDFSKQIIPTSVIMPVDTISVIDENNFAPDNITLKLSIPKKTVNTINTSNISKNYTNTTVTNITNSTPYVPQTNENMSNGTSE